MKLSLTLQDSPLSQTEFDALTQSFPRLHPAWLPQWPAITASGLRQKVFTLKAVWTEDAACGSLTTHREVALAGALSLVWMRSPLFGSHLISVPYVNVGGCLIPDGPHHDEIQTLLINEAVRMADELGVKYLELRNVREISHPSLTFERRGKVLMELELPQTSDELWKQIGPKVRNQIRKGEKAGLWAEWGGKNLLPQFYAVFAETMRNVGTPVYSRHLFEEMFAQLAEKAEICLIRTPANRVASAAILVHGREVTEVPSAGTLRWANASCANMLLYWNLLRHSIESRHACVFDFGRSSVQSGTWHFKKQWGAQEVPIVWKYYVREGSMEDVRPDNSSYGLAIRVWKRLPVWFTRLIGPWIVRGIP